MDKLTSIKIKNPDGSYSDQMPISVLVDNVIYDETHNLKDILNKLRNSMNTIVGTPSVVKTAAEMTNINKIYIYMGNESGYTKENWYYYDNDSSKWTSGGPYNSSVIDTDTTLTLANKAADAQAVGDRFNLVSSQIDNKIIPVRTSLNQTANKADKNASDIAALTIALNGTNEIAQNALASASNAENEVAGASVQIAQANKRIDAIQLSMGDYVNTGYVENGVAYFGHDSDILFEITGIGGGGSGGGGGDQNHAVLTVTNTTGWLSKTIPSNADCPISVVWTSTEDDMPTGDGTMRITVNGSIRATVQIAQGSVEMNLTPYIGDGVNIVRVQVADIYGNARTINFSVTVVALSISSTFDATVPFSSAISFPYIPSGAVSKTVYFILDGNLLGTQETSVSNRQMTYAIPAQAHGAHSIRCYFEAEINGETVRSNELYYEFMCVNPMSDDVIITTAFTQESVSQYTLVNIPYRVYDPVSDTAAVSISVNGNVVSTPTVDRTEQTFSYRANTVGTVRVAFSVGNLSKLVSFTVTESDVDVEAETEDLVLYLNTEGRTNNDSNRTQWKYGNVSATMSNFNWRLDGWLKDSDGVDVLRLVDDARVTIPYKIFGSDFKETGKTIEFEFATRDVVDYNAELITCYVDGVGLKITPQNILFKGAQTEISTLYKDNEHIRLSVVVEKQSENRLILIYINGIMSRAIQYASGERFSQLDPVNISIGSNTCGIDIYTIRVYDNDLNRQQVLENWIADTQLGNVMLERYSHNAVYDEYGRITIANLPSDLPYMIIEATELPQYKGDKKTVTGSYHDPVYPSKSFEFEGCEIDVQGTSSAVYYRKNYDMKYKKGFITSTSGTVSNYALRAGSIPFNRFVLKADVASSESTNNVGLTMFYNDTCPYKTPEMKENSKVRWGIEGVPIVLFWYNPDTQETKFMGKYNFNLPKRAPAPYGYSGNDQSWEVERNNSANVKFQDNDFTSQSWNEVTGEYYPTWYDDWEARFPSDEWRDIGALNEFVSWVKSTARDQATNGNLPESVTYRLNTMATINPYSSDTSYTVVDETEGGVSTGYKLITFTKDTPAYRLTKFKAEMADYMEVESAVFYYIYTEMFLMIDSRAKNMFIGFHGSDVTGSGRQMTRKAVFEPYDMDTAVGTNNSGVLMFGYYLEDTDQVSSIISGGDSGGTDANVFNAQDSILWVNLRDSCRAEITAMYRTLRTGAWSYKTVANMYTEHQSKWPEAIFNEDGYEKYLIPLIDPVTVDEATGQLIKTDRYLTMLQGSKAEQRKWWLYNRFRYMDSKYSTGDASANRITMRLFNNGTLTLKSAIDMYIGVYFGGGTTVALKRTTAGTPQSFPYQAGTTAQEMETWIDSADMITDVGDLSVFYPNELDFSRATRLRRLQIGSSASGYSNSHLTTVDVRNSALLEYIDLRNCPNLAITVNLEGSPRLEEAYFDNTAVTGVDLADGCVIETLHLPSTITTLTLLNLSKLTNFVCPSFANVSRLMLANIDATVVNPVTILSQIRANSQVNIQGLAMEVTTVSEIDTFYDLLDTMRGVTREKNASGEWIYHDYDTAQVSGSIHIGSITGADMAELQARYPYITINADHTSSVLTYVSYDNVTVLKTVNCSDGVPQSGAPSNPSKPQDAQYTYSFVGWSKRKDQTSADSDYAQEVWADRTVYPAYTRTVRTYTVRFYNGSTLLQTVNNVAYGSNATYTGTQPVITGVDDPEKYEFTGWNPAPTNIHGATDCYAQYEYNGILTRKIIDRTISGAYENSLASGIGIFAFYDCSKLTTVSFPNATTIDNDAFYGCRNLTEINAPSVTKINEMAFYNCASLTTVNFPAVTSIGYRAFQNCASLTTVNFPAVESIGYSAFENCKNLVSMYLLGSVVPSIMNSNVFYDTPMRNSALTGEWGSIFVRASLLQSFKTANGWSTLSNRIVGVDEQKGVL